MCEDRRGPYYTPVNRVAVYVIASSPATPPCLSLKRRAHTIRAASMLTLHQVPVCTPFHIQMPHISVLHKRHAHHRCPFQQPNEKNK
jgi:hypothetical protein